MAVMNTERYQLLSENGITPTPQRVAVLDLVLGNRTHPSVDAVFAQLRKKMPSVSKTTVYAALRLFAEKGIVGVVHEGGDSVRYDGEARFHAHFKCRACGGLSDLPLAGRHPRPFAAVPEGFTCESEELTLFGLCPKCGAKKS